MITYNITDIIGDELIMDMTVAGFEFCAELSGDISFEYSAIESCVRKVGVVINNNYNNIVTLDLSPDAGTAIFRLALKPRKYTVRIVKLSEYNCSGLSIKNISFDGTFCDRPERPKLKFEFYGDSITCGYGNLSPDRNSPIEVPSDENGLLSYCALISRRYGADISVASASGFGITISCGGIKTDTWRAFWDKLAPHRNIDWDFDRYIADVVFINLGTNDKEYCRNNPDYSISYDELHSTLKEFIDGIRSHNPNCHLIFVSGAMGEMKQDDRMNADAVYADLEKEYERAYFIPKLYTPQLGGDWHPSVNDHRILADKLTEQLKIRLPEIFDK